MKASPIIAVVALGSFALSACKQEAAAAPVDIRATMQQQVNPATLAIWDVGNNAMNDAGGIDPALMDDAKWAALAEAAGQLGAVARGLAGGTAFIASAPDNAEVAEGEITMAAVQGYVDADPDAFRAEAATLAEHADKLAAAAAAKDVEQTGELVSQMDTVCESCHARFWYPDRRL